MSGHVSLVRNDTMCEHESSVVAGRPSSCQFSGKPIPKIEIPPCAESGNRPGSLSEAPLRDHIMVFGDSCSPSWRISATLEGKKHSDASGGATSGVGGRLGINPARLPKRAVAVLPTKFGSYLCRSGSTAVEAEATGGDVAVGDKPPILTTRGGNLKEATSTEVETSVESMAVHAVVLLESKPTDPSGSGVENTTPTEGSATVESRATNGATPRRQESTKCASKNGGSRDRGTSTKDVLTSVCAATLRSVQPTAFGDGIVVTDDCTLDTQQQTEGRHEGNREKVKGTIATPDAICRLGFQHFWMNNRESLLSTVEPVARNKLANEHRDGDGYNNSHESSNGTEKIVLQENPLVPRRPSSTPLHRNAPGRRRTSVVFSVK